MILPFGIKTLPDQNIPTYESSLEKINAIRAEMGYEPIIRLRVVSWFIRTVNSQKFIVLQTTKSHQIDGFKNRLVSPSTFLQFLYVIDCSQLLGIPHALPTKDPSR